MSEFKTKQKPGNEKKIVFQETSELEDALPTDVEDLTGDEEHQEVDERWLISYADMMTLLFGLFVMLYSLAMENKGNIDDQLSSISAQQNQSAINKNSVDDATRINGLLQQIDALNNALLSKDRNLVALNSRISLLQDKLQGVEQEYHKAKGNVLTLSHQLKTTPQRAPTEDAYKLKVSSLNKDLAGMTEEIGGLNKQIEELAAIRDALKKANQELTDENVELNKKILASNEQIKKQGLQLDQLKQSLVSSENDVKKLKKFIKEEGSSFMIVALKWSTERHDLDLQVTDPNGNSFDFTHRQSAKSRASFVVDSRTGPGLELWESPKVDTGEYQVKVTLYNTYGNALPAEASAFITTKKGEVHLPKFQLDFTTNREKIFRVHINELGEVKILK